MSLPFTPTHVQDLPSILRKWSFSTVSRPQQLFYQALVCDLERSTVGHAGDVVDGL